MCDKEKWSEQTRHAACNLQLYEAPNPPRCCKRWYCQNNSVLVFLGMLTAKLKCCRMSRNVLKCCSTKWKCGAGADTNG